MEDEELRKIDQIVYCDDYGTKVLTVSIVWIHVRNGASPASSTPILQLAKGGSLDQEQKVDSDSVSQLVRVA